MPRKLKRQPKDQSIGSQQLGERIAAVRKQRGITQMDLAATIGIDQRLISSYEVGRVTISAEMLSRIARALAVSADSLLDLTADIDTSENPGRKIMKRAIEIDKLPEQKKKAILKTLDDLIRANA